MKNDMTGNGKGPCPTPQNGNNPKNKAAKVADATVDRLSELMIRHPDKSQGWWAKELGITPARVSQLVQTVLELWHERSAVRADQLVSRELAHIARVESEAWEAWEKSKKTRGERKRAGQRTGGRDGAMEFAEITTEINEGNPRWLEIIVSCIDKRSRITGLMKDQITFNLISVGEKYHGAIEDAMKEVFIGNPDAHAVLRAMPSLPEVLIAAVGERFRRIDEEERVAHERQLIEGKLLEQDGRPVGDDGSDSR